MPQLKTLKKGEILFNEGDTSDFIYYLQQGSLEIYTNNNSQHTNLGTIKANEFVGELGVLQNIPRNANAIASSTTKLEQLSQSEFIRRISQDPTQSLKLLYSLSHRTRNIALLSEQVAKQIAEHKHTLSLNPLSTIFSLINRLFTLVKKQLYKRELSRHQAPPIKLNNGIQHIKKGQTLFREGQDSHFACRIISGKFKAIKSLHNSHKNMGIISAGEFIGEIGLLENTPRSLTIRAITAAEINVMDANIFLSRVSEDPDMSFALIKTLSYRASQLNLHLKNLTEEHRDIVNPTTLKQTKQLLQNIGHLSHLTSDMLEQDLYKLQTALKLEAHAVQDMLEIYYRYINGDATQEEMEQANADFRNFLKTVGLGALIIIPGSFITIPIVVKMAKAIGIDILPKIRS